MNRIKELIHTLEGLGLTQGEYSPQTDSLWTELRRLVDDEPNELYTVEDGWSELYSGTQFKYREPTFEMISIIDITQALSKMCRYGGHTHTFYSVAEHS